VSIAEQTTVIFIIILVVLIRIYMEFANFVVDRFIRLFKFFCNELKRNKI